MLHEFAVEPEVLSNWETFRYFDAQFGVPHGRLISKFPKQWKRDVYNACKGCRDVERKRIEEWLKQDRFHAKIVSFKTRPYNKNRDWLLNAEKQHGLHPFRAIIAKENPNIHDDVLVADLLDEETPLFAVPRGKKVVRRASKIVEVIAGLLQLSREILIIDPYFNPEIPRWWNVLEEIVLESTKNDRKLSRLELHCRSGEAGTVEHWQNTWVPKLAAIIPYNEILRIVTWGEKQSGERFHARYILTECGGLSFDSGLDEGRSGDTTNVSLLDRHLHSLAWSDYQEHDENGNKKVTTFQKVNELCVSGSK